MAAKTAENNWETKWLPKINLMKISDYKLNFVINYVQSQIMYYVNSYNFIQNFTLFLTLFL